MRLRRLLMAAAATVAVMAPLTMIPATSASASTGVLCNVHPASYIWPCMQINGYGNTIYDIAGWAAEPAGFGIDFVGDTVHLEFTGPGGVFSGTPPVSTSNQVRIRLPTIGYRNFTMAVLAGTASRSGFGLPAGKMRGIHVALSPRLEARR